MNSETWMLKRNGMLPILNVMVLCKNIKAEPILVRKMANVIEAASKIKGIPFFHNDEIKQINFPLCIYCSIMFPAEKEFQEFVQKFKNGEVIKIH